MESRSRLALTPLYLQAGLAATAAEIALRFLPLDRVARLAGMSLEAGGVGTMPTSYHAIRSPVGDRLRAANAVMRRWPFGDTCLRRALVLGWLLRQHHPRLAVGVARDGENVVAHAWVESSVGTFGFDGSSQRLRMPVTLPGQ